MDELTYIHRDADSVGQMQESYYKQHQDKFSSIVDIWKMHREENLKLIKRCNPNKK